LESLVKVQVQRLINLDSDVHRWWQQQKKKWKYTSSTRVQCVMCVSFPLLPLCVPPGSSNYWMVLSMIRVGLPLTCSSSLEQLT
jgi:hypothetical protein